MGFKYLMKQYKLKRYYLSFFCISFLMLTFSLPVFAENDYINIDLPVEKNPASMPDIAINPVVGKNPESLPDVAGNPVTKVSQKTDQHESDGKKDGIILERPVEKSEIPLPEMTKTPEVIKNTDPNAGAISVKPDTPFSREKIVEVDIQGNQYVPSEEIMSVVSTKPGDTMSTDQLQKDLQGIFELGYFTDVKFDPEITEDGIRVIFRVLENPKVKKIEFKGNELVTSQELLNLMETKVGQIFNSSTFEKDLKSINDYYSQELGMTGVPTHIAELSTPEPGVFLLSIIEGMKVTGIDFSGNTVIDSDTLRKAVSSKPGDYLNVLAVNRDLAAISKLYDDQSLIIDQPLTAETSPEGVVTYIITEARVEKFVVSGNTKTKDEVILRELRKIKEGDIINKKLLSDDIQRINNLQFFEDVSVVPKPTGKPGFFILEIQVKEAKTGLATAGVGFSGGSRNEGITGSITLSERNLFGTGRSIQLLLQRGGLVTNYNVTYMEPYLTASGLSVGASVYYSVFEEQRQSIYNIPNQSYALFTDKRTGCSVTVGQPVTDEFRLYGTLKISQVDSFSTPTKDNPALARNTGTGDIRSLMFSGLYDTRDNYADTHAGFFTNFSLEHAGWLGGDFDFSKYSFDTRKYFPIGEHTLAFRVLGGTSTGDLPLSDQFYLGGNDTLRAYEQGEFLGDRVFLFQAEYRFPILKSRVLQGALFFDAGNATQRDSVKGLFDNIKSDEGIGIRVAVPALGIGAIRVDYAIKNEGGGGRIVIGIGQTF